jgi:hypothetical protein
MSYTTSIPTTFLIQRIRAILRGQSSAFTTRFPRVRRVAAAAAILLAVALIAFGPPTSFVASTAPTAVPSVDQPAIPSRTASREPARPAEPTDSFAERIFAIATSGGRVAERRAARLQQRGIRGFSDETVAPKASTSASERSLLDILGVGAEGQVLTVKTGRLVWANPAQPGTGRLPAELRGNASDGRSASRGGGGSAPAESADGRLESHDHQTDAGGSVLDINAATKNTLSVSRGGTGMASYSTGALLVGQASGGLEAISIGDEGQFLSVLNGTAAWATLPPSFSSGNVLSLADPRYVNAAGDTMTGTLILAPSSGFAINARGTISGSLVTQNGAGNNYFMGNVGIGTTTPSSALDISGATSDTAGNGMLTLRDNSSPSAFVWGFRIANSASTPSGSLNIDARSGGVDVTRLSINRQLGYVGIGSANPTTTLFIVGNSQAIQSQQSVADNTLKRFGLTVGHYANSTSPMQLILGISGAADNDLYIGGGRSDATAATAIRFLTAANNATTTGTERMRITNAGDVGIGTASPKAKLDVLGTISGSLVTQNGAGNNYFRGNLGIGTAAPSTKLHVLNTTDNAFAATIESNTTFGTSNGLKIKTGTTGDTALGLRMPGAQTYSKSTAREGSASTRSIRRALSTSTMLCARSPYQLPNLRLHGQLHRSARHLRQHHLQAGEHRRERFQRHGE